MKNNIIETAMKKLKQLILLCIFGCVPALWAGAVPIKEDRANSAPDDLYVVRLESIELLDIAWAEKHAGDEKPDLFAIIRAECFKNGKIETETKEGTYSAIFTKKNTVRLLNPRKESFTVDCMDYDGALPNDLLFTVIVRGEDVLAHKNRELVYSVNQHGRVTISSEDSDERGVVGRVKFSVEARSGAETQFQIGRAFFNGCWDCHCETGMVDKVVGYGAKTCGWGAALLGLPPQFYLWGLTLDSDRSSHDKGQYWKKDEKEAVKCFEKAAKQGHPRATAQMGACYRYGKGVDPDEKKAAEWFKKAANLGDNWGQFCYGACLCEGRGVEKNVQAGVGWVRKAIANGYNPKFAKEYLEKILEGNQ